jgi:predicted membrane protein
MSSIILGLIFLAAGVLLFAFNSGLLMPELRHVVFSWPMFLVALGFAFLFSRDKWVAGVILLLVGGFFLLPRLNIERLDFITQNGWAIGLILVGVIVLFRAVFGRHFLWRTEWHCPEKKWDSFGWKNHKDESGRIDYNCVFTGGKKNLDTKNFRGGEINNVFGGLELDLTDAQMPEGVHFLEINSVFGGVVLYVPVEWKVEIRQSSQVFGSFVDNRPKPSFEVDEKRTLIIEANAVFGGGEIKCK